MAARFDATRAAELGQTAGDGTPIMLTIPTDQPWVPLRILSLGLDESEVVDADVFLLTDDQPQLLAGGAGPHARPQRAGRRRSLLDRPALRQGHGVGAERHVVHLPPGRHRGRRTSTTTSPSPTTRRRRRPSPTPASSCPRSQPVPRRRDRSRCGRWPPAAWWAWSWPRPTSVAKIAATVPSRHEAPSLGDVPGPVARCRQGSRPPAPCRPPSRSFRPRAAAEAPTPRTCRRGRAGAPLARQ